LNKAERMRWRRCAERAPRIKKPRKPTPPPPPVRKVDSGWTEDATVCAAAKSTPSRNGDE
jgi:hypothetical protein